MRNVQELIDALKALDPNMPIVTRGAYQMGESEPELVTKTLPNLPFDALLGRCNLARDHLAAIKLFGGSYLYIDSLGGLDGPVA